MSLINEALKKAQRQRVEDPASATPSEPSTGGAPAPRIPLRRPPLPTSTLVVLFGGAGTLLVMAGVFVFIFFLSDSDPVPPANAPAAVAVRPETAPAAPATPPVVAVEPTPPAVPSPSVAVQLPPAAPPPPAAPAVAAPTLYEPAPAPASASAGAPAANPKVYEYLESLRVSGIRVSATDPKVIINDRVYRLNDLVDRGTKLRLTGVEPSTLTFVDDAGFEYRKSF